MEGDFYFLSNISVQLGFLPYTCISVIIIIFSVNASKGCISLTESPLSMLVPGSWVERRGNWKQVSGFNARKSKKTNLELRQEDLGPG